jgi:hypothetical protein
MVFFLWMATSLHWTKFTKLLKNTGHKFMLINAMLLDSLVKLEKGHHNFLAFMEKLISSVPLWVSPWAEPQEVL